MRARRQSGTPAAARTARGTRRAAAGVLLALPLVLAAACGQPDPSGGGRTAGPGDGAGAGPSPSLLNVVFLAEGECSTRGRQSFDEVPCGSERAVAKVLLRFHGGTEDGPVCPARTDFLLHITERPDGVGDTGDGGSDARRGYACMRNLEPPHPGDPGGGGGPRTIAGDCVRLTRKNEVREVSCAESAVPAPEFKVIKAVAKRSACPTSTDLYVRLGGDKPTGCARRL
ncbi:hypothetical protein KBZ10_03280 [Streptomyces sp. F63]|uniref:hypothetical protein n=1 Tax=Streptomyces sp. F63 TaxID=2824887 RepID=UPI001B382603|nr:hypothetical protein [Streptomyces sp. F63]MBQ0983567.1 hypothetical protein [Streptomyces sp. F63]